MSWTNRQRILVVSQSPEVRNELVTLLSGYGYFVELAANRLDAARNFRNHKQHIVIFDVPSLRTFPKRLFGFIQTIRKNTIVLIAAHQREEAEAFRHLRLGAYDILNLPLSTDFLRHTMNRAMSYHKTLLENLFVKNAVFFSLLMAPIWAALVYVVWVR